MRSSATARQLMAAIESSQIQPASNTHTGHSGNRPPFRRSAPTTNIQPYNPLSANSKKSSFHKSCNAKGLERTRKLVTFSMPYLPLPVHTAYSIRANVISVEILITPKIQPGHRAPQMGKTLEFEQACGLANLAPRHLAVGAIRCMLNRTAFYSII